MSLARCPEPECQRVLDVSEIQASWRCPDGRCAACNNLAAREPKIIQRRTYEKRGVVTDTIDKAVAIPAVDTGPKVERGIPIPTVAKKGTSQRFRYPFKKLGKPRSDDDMDSFLVKFENAKTKDQQRKLAATVSSAAYAHRKTHGLSIKFTVRTVDDGIRVWRIA